MLAEAFHQYSGAVLALAQQLLEDGSQAELVVRDVYLLFWANPESFEAQSGSLRSYLLVQCRRRVAEMLRAEGAARRTGSASASNGDVPSPTAQRKPNGRHLTAPVDAVLATLSPQEREAVELAYFEGYSYREVAVMLGEPTGTVKAHIRTGMSLLRQAFIEAGMSSA